MPERIQQAMQSQVEAERRKRAAILESEGQRAATINVAEGEKRSRILASEAFLQEQINQAEGKARAIVLEADARRTGEQWSIARLQLALLRSCQCGRVAERARWSRRRLTGSRRAVCCRLWSPCSTSQHPHRARQRFRCQLNGRASNDCIPSNRIFNSYIAILTSLCIFDTDCLDR